MKYSRVGVKKYVEDYWWRPCKDNSVWIKTRRLHIPTLVAEMKGNPRQKPKLTAPAYEGAFLTYGPENLEGLFLVPAGQQAQTRTNDKYTDFKARGAIMLASYKDSSGEEAMDLSRLDLYPPFYGLNDCTHFTTECLIAGGFPPPNEHARRGAEELYVHLSNHPNVVMLASDVSQLDASRVIATFIMKTGDVVIYKTEGTRNRHHAVVFLTEADGGVSGGSIAMHTWHRFGADWKTAGGDDDDQQYSLFHVVDDNYHAADHAAWIGWWAISQGIDTRYVYLDTTGHVATSMQPPKTKAAPAAGKDRWFADSMRMWIFSKARGSLELFLVNPMNRQAAMGQTRDGVQLVAARLFAK